ncbi:unnamed protein product [Porites lobata]|uniref:Uncharacterized protein n=1 Tax=Porites lobata TaxID=104759 RepID=A0ABN8NG72_9CNID|nr:unnamed protein product [Porites lobata]
MGQTLSCTSCKFGSAKIAPLRTLPSAMKRSNPSIVGQKTFSFHRPSHSSPEWLSVELSNCSSLATISLGSVKTISSKLRGEITNNEITQEENKGSSPSSKKHPVADNDIQEEPELVCKHGIPLNGAIRDSHKVNCVKCERPFSRGGRALAGMLAFRRAETKRRKSKRILNTKRLSAEQEKRKRMEGEYDDALRRFAEKHPSN